jgi:hypothetical protein
MGKKNKKNDPNFQSILNLLFIKMSFIENEIKYIKSDIKFLKRLIIAILTILSAILLKILA